MDSASLQAGTGSGPDPAAQPPRPLDRGWRKRHIRWQAEGIIPAGKTPLLYEDMTPVFNRRGTPRMWSEHVAIVTDPSLRSSRAIARERAKAAEDRRIAAEAAKLQGMVHRSLRPPAGRLWSVHADALLLIGPSGGIPVSSSAVAALEPLTSGGRHALSDHDRAALDGLAPRLAAVGLRIERRKTGWRIARARSTTTSVAC